MQRGRVSRRENNRVVFERLWRGTFQAVLAGPQRRARASSHDPTPESQAVVAMPQQGPSHVADSLEPALRTILEGLRQSCCCRCNCNANERNFNDNLQVCLSNEEERKSMRSVIRCAYCLIDCTYRLSMLWFWYIWVASPLPPCYFLNSSLKLSQWHKILQSVLIGI